MQDPKPRPTGKSGRVGSAGSGGGLCEEVTEGWGFAIEIVMEGWVSKMRLPTNSVSAACVRKAVRLDMREAVAACQGVMHFGSGEVGGFLTPTASN